MKFSKKYLRQIQNGGILKFDKWGKYIEFLNEESESFKKCLFRGQLDSNWKLKPSIFRDINEEAWTCYQAIYDQQLQNFKMFTRGKHRLPFNDPQNDEREWWALGQHYGLKTPLMDWVRSPYVAAYFAFKDEQLSQSEDVAIYMLSDKAISQDYEETAGKLKIYDPLTHDNSRLLAQQGVFVYIASIFQNEFSTIEEYLETIKTKEEMHLLKVIMPHSERKFALRQLNLMNINQATLFPDLSGAARHCNYLFECQVVRSL